jgi:HAMP domain-containing protein
MPRADRSRRKHGARPSWSRKLTALLLAFAVLPTLVMSSLLYRNFERTHEQATLQQLEGRAGTKAQSVDHFMSTRLRQVERIAFLVAPSFEAFERHGGDLPVAPTGELPDPPSDTPDPIVIPAPAREGVTTDTTGAPTSPSGDTSVADSEESEREAGPDALESVSEGAAPNSRALGEAHPEELRRTLGLLLWDQKDYEELLVIDHEGIVRVSTFDGHEGRDAAAIEYFHNGLRATFVQPAFLSPITERLTMVIATPIRDHSQRVVGVLAARLNLETFFRLLADDTGLGRSGETVIGRKIDSEVLFMAPTRHDPEAASNRRITIGGDHSRPLQEAARGQAGTGYAIDYRGHEVLAAWRHIPSLRWGLVVKMDRDEAWEAIVEMRQEFLAWLLVVLVGVVLASMWTARALVAPLRELKDATDRLSKGDLDVKLRIDSRDEIGELADSFERMVAAIKFFRGGPEVEPDAEEHELARGSPNQEGEA